LIGELFGGVVDASRVGAGAAAGAGAATTEDFKAAVEQMLTNTQAEPAFVSVLLGMVDHLRVALDEPFPVNPTLVGEVALRRCAPFAHVVVAAYYCNAILQWGLCPRNPCS
jgi:hypothetical protein